MRNAKLLTVAVVLVVLLACVSSVSAETLTLNPTGDNTLYVKDAYGTLYDGDKNWGRKYYTNEYFFQCARYGFSTFPDVTYYSNAILSFDLNQAALQTPGFVTTIESVSLNIHQLGAGSNYTDVGTVEVYQLLHDFVEGNKNSETATAEESCWDYLSYNTVPWNTPGAQGVGTDHGGTMLASWQGTSNLPGWRGFTSTSDFSTLVQGTIGGTLNLWATGEADDPDNMFLFRGNARLSGPDAPKLIIEYTKTAVPEPGTIALLTAGLLGLLAYAWRKRK